MRSFKNRALSFSIVLALLMPGDNVSSAESVSSGGSITIVLHPASNTPTDRPVSVSFGLPLAPRMLERGGRVRVVDESGREVPTFVRSLLPWRDVQTGRDQLYLRAVHVHFEWVFTTAAPQRMTLVVGDGMNTTRREKKELRQDWVLVNDREYPASAGVYEPRVYVTLPPSYLAKAGVYPPTLPFSDAQGADQKFINSAQPQFFRTAINDVDARVRDEQRVSYLTDPESWLFDRASVFFKTYIRSGDIQHLRAAHRAAAFYMKHLNHEGYFTLKKGNDLKYSYGEPILADYLLLANETALEKVRSLTQVAAHVDVNYRRPDQFWTERHAAYALLAALTVFESTGDPHMAARARRILDDVLSVQSKPPAFIVAPARHDGCFIHTAASHGEGETHQYVCSPWMTSLLLAAMQRYELSTDDPRIPASAMAMADFTLRLGSRIDDSWLHGLNTPHRRMRIPYYLVSSKGVLEDDPWADKEHALDAAKIVALGYYYARRANDPRAGRFRAGALEFLRAARVNLEGWIRPEGLAEGKAIYRLSPSRKFNWWFTHHDIDYLLSG